MPVDPDTTRSITDVTALDVETLKRMCLDDGYAPACDELDRRGVEPDIIPPDPPPVPRARSERSMAEGPLRV